MGRRLFWYRFILALMMVFTLAITTLCAGNELQARYESTAKRLRELERSSAAGTYLCLLAMCVLACWR